MFKYRVQNGQIKRNPSHAVNNNRNYLQVLSEIQLTSLFFGDAFDLAGQILMQFNPK